jgi:short-subunit dehydrogenase
VTDRSAVVTGASSGIGEALASILAARGYELLLVARRASTLEKLSAELAERHNATCEFLAADLTDRADIEHVAREIKERSVTTVVNNAGFGSYGPFHELPLFEELNEIQLNIAALVALSHSALEVMVPRRSGGLLNVASTASFQPGPRNATYSASKAFVRSFTEALHEEVLPSGVHVTALCPGFTRTEFQRRAGMPTGAVPDFLWSDATSVATAGLDALERNHAVCVPGIPNKVGVVASRLAPIPVARKVAGRILGRMRSA